MAAPITHIVLANKVFSKEFPLFSREKFFVGTSFPDIRYLGVIERSKTHFTSPLLADIKKENDAQAGMMFHSFVDGVREKVLKEAGIYKMIPKNGISIQTLKLLEDEVLYNKIEDWKVIASYFDSILAEELAYPIGEDSIKRWHNALQHYFVEGPNAGSRKVLFTEMNFSDENTFETEEILAEMRQNDKIIDMINDFYNKFGEKIN
ncbi:MAG: hypothetical protein UW46_C0004G0045 [Candidatus Yanofskybacteria bacterium GW2011_GWF1_44_227]|uniref:Uncharacterized protein n=1 Tax=Candidatus Yanofskybacteria bacterium GW2011_GWE2_40_11 TaxID=1619033 RepID=A0A0G0QT78_9BACT|nr:MAG: hypothetical protein UT75_C0007G0019 [Candidatus Yanofskybacteria bacterium GW2011_GWE2_40_11]KKT15633.1 MAG: hypothetical protein UV97_C0004G0049 [Candidatus Yanofskybacteria bacterium GW2011_GWF2_43_596]KKT53318.1 MAG: hypothetical protein UW46_C0004G0045 [Candidatus Yanofskybacteria bacterium GW2011_GWF1_44_227]OGN35948.1 MAG: hypothetical protein A2207_02720 [Candidatus Yanofskybacteria bacterium RIFOXYA1_FULL_44_17]OGN36450.1 MAG: hypothetical protein A2241_01765 [Candidatus Yanofs